MLYVVLYDIKLYYGKKTILSWVGRRRRRAACSAFVRTNSTRTHFTNLHPYSYYTVACSPPKFNNYFIFNFTLFARLTGEKFKETMLYYICTSLSRNREIITIGNTYTVHTRARHSIETNTTYSYYYGRRTIIIIYNIHINPCPLHSP